MILRTFCKLNVNIFNIEEGKLVKYKEKPEKGQAD